MVVEWLAVDAKVATVLGMISASSDTVESEGRQMKQCCITFIKKIKTLDELISKSLRYYILSVKILKFLF